MFKYSFVFLSLVLSLCFVAWFSSQFFVAFEIICSIVVFLQFLCLVSFCFARGFSFVCLFERCLW